MKTSLRNEIRNGRAIRSMKDAFKEAANAIVAKQADAKALVHSAISIIDKVAEQGIIHRNKAARKKSQLALRLNAFSAPRS